MVLAADAPIPDAVWRACCLKGAAKSAVVSEAIGRTTRAACSRIVVSPISSVGQTERGTGPHVRNQLGEIPQFGKSIGVGTNREQYTDANG